MRRANAAPSLPVFSTKSFVTRVELLSIYRGCEAGLLQLEEPQV